MSKTRMSGKCLPKEFSRKSFFLAPNAENREVLIAGIVDIFNQWFNWRQEAQQSDGPFFGSEELNSPAYLRAQEQLKREIHDLSLRFLDEIPRHSPRYIGHMYSEYTIPAFFGHLLALMYNPNNISSEVSRVGLDVEKQAIRMLAKMIGYPGSATGHFTSGGTIANFEMLFRVKLLSLQKKGLGSPGPKVLIVPDSAHYSWEKGMALVGDSNAPKSELCRVPLDDFGRMSLSMLKRALMDQHRRGADVIGVVSVLGSTELGVMDPVDQVSKLLHGFQRKWGTRIWHHVDAAYGGFWATLRGGRTDGSREFSIASMKAIRGLKYADSITLDPHKLGYVPYASGCFLCRRPSDYRVTGLHAPYLDYRSISDPGPFTLEGSRTAAGALAIYLTDRTIGLDENGLGGILVKSLRGARRLRQCIEKTKRFRVLNVSPSNIVCFSDKGSARTLMEMNRRTLALYGRIKKASQSSLAEKPYFVSKTTLGHGHQKLISNHCRRLGVQMGRAQELVLIRCTIMNPFFMTKHSRTEFASDFVNWISLSI